MLLIDFSPLIIASFIAEPVNEEPLFRHMALNSIRSITHRFKKEYGSDVVLACDSKSSWRKNFFPYYKAKRAEAKAESSIDWGKLFRYMDTLKQELKEFSPYKVIEIDGAEADDVIAILCQIPRTGTLIISADKDFLQLQKFPHVKQFSRYHDKLLVSVDPEQTLIEHIITGDRSDGIPNVLSEDDVFVVGKRQVIINKNRKEKILAEKTAPYWERNMKLISFSSIPEDIQQKITEAYNIYCPANKQKFMNYMISKRLSSLIQSLDEF